MKRANVTVSRNDVRPDGFKRWTVYAGGKAVFDIEATGLDNGKALVHVLDAGDGRRTFVAYDGRSDSFFHDAPDPGSKGHCGRCGGDGAAGAAGLCRDCEDGRPIIGERSSCALCTQDIEWSGDGWRDRGNGIDCLPFTKNGEVIQPGPTWMHQPEL